MIIVLLSHVLNAFQRNYLQFYFRLRPEYRAYHVIIISTVIILIGLQCYISSIFLLFFLFEINISALYT